jgi:mannose-6-phosphate isomerase-like protein (cupin superfamily)
MRAHLTGLVLALALPLAAEAAEPPGPLMSASAADVQALIAKAKSDRKPGQNLTVEPLLRLAPYGVNLEYRTGVAPAAVHETEAEMFYVIDGAATVVTGGKLAGEKRTNPTNLTGTGIDSGTPRKVAKGDFWIVPQGTPHWFSSVEGVLVLMSLHLPRTTP